MKADKLAAFEASTLMAARLILADPEAHGGDNSLAVRWARLVSDRLAPAALAPKQGQIEMFQEVA